MPLGTAKDVEAPQPQVAMPVDDEAHQPRGPELWRPLPIKTCIVEGLNQAPLH
jgi:hypothetical protein